MIPSFILPANVQLKADAISSEPGVLHICASVCQPCSTCPICSKKSNRIHSRYSRKLLDLPVSGHLARVKLKARKYFCDNPACHRKIFTERFDSEIKPYYRRMLRSNDLLARMALELGGNTGATISRYVGIPVSPSTVLRVVKKLEIQSKTLTSGIIGVDDWAFKKGRTYGTVLVDLERKEVIDLLPDRESETLAEWLKKHPEIKTVSRDRYGPYALGVKKGAPQAHQVADRFHLLMNLGEAVKRVIQSKGKELKEVFNLYNNPQKEHAPAAPRPQPVQCTPELETSGDSVANISIDRQHKFEQVKKLYNAGYSIRQIAKTVNVSRTTTQKYVHMEQLPKRESCTITNLDAFLDFLLQENNRGKTYRELHQIITQMGFNGKYSQFCFKMNKMQPSFRAKKINPTPIKTWSPTKLSFMLYLEPDQLPRKDDQDFLKLLYEKCPDIKQMEQLVKSFKNLFLLKEDGSLMKWIDETAKSECGLKNFAKNILKDYEAVNNAVITPFSNGQVEGQVNRIKNIKRKMYGRASFELLRKMVLAKSA
ncbi:ISL3 family transposase [Solitalea lacus]|uniref:ISL3 family transposase n=1 Tax=Solitalea lacus TaxID=2911172 RepID=UPI001EDBB941|nr:ISL3 family transposase [Solitalea lacus]UKJ06195.1 ISL3 family transposase [Solitalea lacus]UKJ07793.1 ISL3 family transposase [Solitalea lacus]UKJ07797.1 ISL3 family transposase [Solitalea lacus]